MQINGYPVILEEHRDKNGTDYYEAYVLNEPNLRFAGITAGYACRLCEAYHMMESNSGKDNK